MAEWWSIEVLHGEFSAFRWQEQHDSALIEAALTNGAVDGAWHADRWGVVFEMEENSVAPRKAVTLLIPLHFSHPIYLANTSGEFLLCFSSRKRIATLASLT